MFGAKGNPQRVTVSGDWYKPPRAPGFWTWLCTAIQLYELRPLGLPAPPRASFCRPTLAGQLETRMTGPHRSSWKLPDWLRAMLADARGSTAVIFAIAAPALALLVAGTVDLSSLTSDRSTMQDVADATALEAAKELGIGVHAGIASRAQNFASTQLGDVGRRVAYTVNTTFSGDGSQVTVAIDGSRGSFFGNILPPGGWKIHVQATAATLGKLPLCVLSSGTNKSNTINLSGSSQATATGCMVHSNSDVTVTGGAKLAAGMVQSTGAASGNISPAPQVGAPAIADPFAAMSIVTPLGLCTPLDQVFTSGAQVLAPGIHCGNITVENGATLTLLPGEHYFLNGRLTMEQSSTLSGSNVVLIFDAKSEFQFDGTSQVNLSGRLTGPYAGFVIATTRTNINTFSIATNGARQLVGTIYIPKAKLEVTGTGDSVADQSAWTVVVAHSIHLTGSANLVINSNYATSSVPVPAGVGPSGSAQVTLAK